MNHKLIHRNHQQGQAILLIAILMVALIASLGLAIDGGGMFFLYRDVQNATDAAALSAAFALCTGDNPQEAGAYAAEINGFVTGVDGATVTVTHPPVSGSYAGNMNYVSIEIESEKPSYFIQVVYDGPLTVSASTVSQCTGGGNFGWPDNSAMIALWPDCAAGPKEPFRMSGQGSVTTIGGGVFINSDGDNGSCDVVAAKGQGDGDFGGYGLCAYGDSINGTVSNPPNSSDDLYATEGGSIDTNCGTQVNTMTPLEDAGLTPPNCGSLPNRGSLNSYNSDAQAEANPNLPGNYTSFDIGSKKFAYLATGIYCISDTYLQWQGQIESDAVDGVFLYADTGNSGFEIKGNAQGETILYALSDNTSPYQNLLMWVNDNQYGNNVGIEFRGGNNFSIQGTVYAPYKHCDLAGSSDDSKILYAQFICRSVDLTGKGDLTIQFLPSLVYDIPPTFGVTE